MTIKPHIYRVIWYSDKGGVKHAKDWGDLTAAMLHVQRLLHAGRQEVKVKIV